MSMLVPNGDLVQKAYVITNEWSKLQRFMSVFIEWVAAGLVFSTLLPGSGQVEVWRPMIALFLTMFAAAIRLFADQNHILAQKCRRVVMDCAVTEVDTPKQLQLSLSEQVPLLSYLALPLAKKSNMTVWGYYGQHIDLRPVGAARQAHLNAYSAFFTWQNTKIIASFSILVFGVLMLATLTFVYIEFVSTAKAAVAAAKTQTSIDMATLAKVLDLICTGVIGFVGLRFFLAWKSASGTAKTCQAIAESLTSTPSTDAVKINQLSKEYEFERLIGKQPSTLVYWFTTRTIERKWSSYLDLIKSLP